MVDAKKLAENVWVLILSRAAMLTLPIVLPITMWLLTDWLEGKFAGAHAAIATQSLRIDDVETATKDMAEATDDLEDRVLKMETSNQRGREARDAMQEAMIKRLEQMDRSIGELTSTVAALKATVDILIRQSSRSRLPELPSSPALPSPG